MSLRADQLEFAAHLRDPDGHPAPPGLEPRRVAVYRGLLFKNVLSFMQNGFPVIRKTLGDDAFATLVRTWFAQHRATTPIFPRMPGELIAWLADTPRAAAGAPPWLTELAHYEWIELELQLDPAEIDVDGVDADGDLRMGVPVLSPLARVLAYDWPVHRIGPDYRPETPEPTTLLVYRDRSDGVRFMETNAMTHALLALLRDNETATGETLLRGLAVRDAALSLLESLRERDIIAGARS
ncbi:MAG: putative DNA-binding domain-containing protein [Gammaproteobacteria bacterium]